MTFAGQDGARLGGEVFHAKSDRQAIPNRGVWGVLYAKTPRERLSRGVFASVAAVGQANTSR